MIHCLIYADMLEDGGKDTFLYRYKISRFLNLKPRISSRYCDSEGNIQTKGDGDNNDEGNGFGTGIYNFRFPEGGGMRNDGKGGGCGCGFEVVGGNGYGDGIQGDGSGDGCFSEDFGC